MKYQFDYDRKCKIRINDDWWELYIITVEEAEELEEDGFRAITYSKEHGQAMIFTENSISKAIVAHELFHVYTSYFNIDSANLSIKEFEEIVAEFLEANADKFIRIRNKVYNRLKKLEEIGKKK